jgi:hypothetical protein
MSHLSASCCREYFGSSAANLSVKGRVKQLRAFWPPVISDWKLLLFPTQFPHGPSGRRTHLDL